MAAQKNSAVKYESVVMKQLTLIAMINIQCPSCSMA